MKILTLIIFLLPQGIIAQIKFKNISVDQGLSQSAVSCITQDSLGYLWIGTRDGLNQFDGKNFKIFRNDKDDSSSIANNTIWSLCSDNEGGVWAATASGISYYDPLNEIFINYSPSQSIHFPECNSITIFGDSIMIASIEGLWVFNKSLKKWSKPEQFSKKKIHFVNTLDNNSCIIASNKNVFHIKKDKLTSLLSDSITNYKAFYQNEKELFIATTTDLYILDKTFAFNKKIHLSDNPIKNKISISQDKNGRIWISGNGIYLLSSDYTSVQHLLPNRYDENSLSNLSTSNVFTSDDGTVWVGTNGFGIDKHNLFETSITTITSNSFNENTLSNQYVSGIYARDNVLYVGSRNVIDIFNTKYYPLKKIGKIELSGFNAQVVVKISKSSNGNILAGIKSGLVEISSNLKVQKRIDNYRIVDFDYLSDGRILNATTDENKGLIVYDPTDFSYKQLNLLPEKESLRVILVEDDVIWVGSSRAIYKVANTLDSYEVVTKEMVPFPVQIMSIYRDSQGILWVGTWGEGLYRYDEEKQFFIPFKYNTQLPNQTIYGILEDNFQNLWMSSNNGLICYKRDTDQLIGINKNLDIQSNEFNTGSYFKDEAGILYFGGIKGISYFNPKDLLSINTTSKLFISNIWVNQKLLNRQDWRDNKLIFQHDQNNVFFTFTSIYFNNSTTLKYRYKLEGKTEYIDNGDLNSINLANLRPGDYNLIINSTDHYGIWKDDVTSIKFTILPPLWQQKWFIIFMSCLMIALGIIINFLRIVNYQKKNKKLELAVKERTYQITEKNNEILAQNEELMAQSNKLSDQHDQLEAQNVELLDLKDSLERRVNKRTVDLKEKNKELLLQNQQLEQFNYITSHNLKGPIASLKGLLSLLPPANNSSDENIIDKIQQSVLKLDSVVNDLALIIDMRRKADDLSVINLSAILNQVVTDLTKVSQENNVELVLKTPDNIIVKGIKAYIYSIFYNLIHNGIKYRKMKGNEDYVHIHCSVENQNVAIQIADNGIGIEMKYAENKLFKLFQRFNNTYEGKGIGLYMTKIQVESMNGHISLKSKKGLGTTIDVCFPLHSDE